MLSVFMTEWPKLIKMTFFFHLVLTPSSSWWLHSESVDSLPVYATLANQMGPMPCPNSATFWCWVDPATAKLCTHHLSIHHMPEIITHCPPLSTVEDLHPTRTGAVFSINQTGLPLTCCAAAHCCCSSDADLSGWRCCGWRNFRDCSIHLYLQLKINTSITVMLVFWTGEFKENMINKNLIKCSNT